MPKEDRGLVSEVGPVEIDWPRSIGYYGGIALAVSLELVPLSIGLFIGAYPLLKMLNRPNASKPVRFASQVLEGVAKPVGGDAEGTIRLKDKDAPLPQPKALVATASDASTEAKPAPKPRVRKATAPAV